jgi:putative transposase
MIDHSLNELYEVLEITKQGVWDHFRREEAELELIARVIGLVDEHRKQHPGKGLRKLYEQIEPEGIGRDKFCRVFKQLGYGIRRRSNPIRTTIPAHKVFDNLIEGRHIDGPGQVWQSDITYFKVGARHYYLTFIIDVHTRRIVGYAVSDSLRAEANIRALKMALEPYDEQELEGLVHHSDRGSQYTDSRYLQILRSHGIIISMGKKAQDNAYAERVNGVIKNEYLIYRNLSGLKDLSRYTRQAVNDYNTKRHHGALGRLSPMDYESLWKKLDPKDRKRQVILSEKTPKNLEASLQEKVIDTACQYPYCTLNLN